MSVLTMAIEEIVEHSDKICGMLDKIAESDKMFCVEMCLMMEQYSHDVYRMRNHINELKYFGG